MGSHDSYIGTVDAFSNRWCWDHRYPDSYEAEMLDTVSLGITLVMFFLSLMSWLISKFWHRHDWSDEDDDDEDESHDKTS